MKALLFGLVCCMGENKKLVRKNKKVMLGCWGALLVSLVRHRNSVGEAYFCGTQSSCGALMSSQEPCRAQTSFFSLIFLWALLKRRDFLRSTVGKVVSNAQWFFSPILVVTKNSLIICNFLQASHYLQMNIFIKTSIIIVNIMCGLYIGVIHHSWDKQCSSIKAEYY